MTVRRIVTPWASAALVLTALLATSCAGDKDNDASPAATSSSATPHGYVEGAQEAAEQQSRLLLNDPESGDSRVLDLITGKVHKAAQMKGTVRLGTDGRFGYLHASGGTRVIDSGAWTVDHGDHVHYYSAAIRDVGELPGDSRAQVRSDAAVTAVTSGGGRTVLYDRSKLEKGRIESSRTLPRTYSGAVVPYEEHLLAFADEDGTTKFVVLDREGERVATPDVECEEPRGDAVTRRGVILGCAGGALLVRAQGGAFSAEEIPYGRNVPAKERATAFRLRPGSDTLTAPAGDDAVWVLDVAERTWTRVETGPVVAANTAGEGSPLLVLETDGSLHGYDIATGKQTARTKPLLTGGKRAGSDGSAPVIEVDRSRAYVNDPDGKKVLEIDYNDSLRIARSFDLDVKPVLMAETGR
ncbi:hypothetical protein HTV80_03585 [Streptomyces sp. Vc74B-19]|uniref:hypothetical protein n=1 Tax=unclassified Streptomyces TaxID=2593676 RepID=UPI001BFCB161|nr:MULTISPECIES: hypothetical protein [unclassified Streptomyces]MBT3162195.1 hypothetical protein [Streptomyces sp. Vc74B-19]MCO4699088.1 hypothetical protein [Streptomyces sp. RO-S4]MDU0300070.1 hypothetical protein [Streptomyces sp. PAL114]